MVLRELVIALGLDVDAAAFSAAEKSISALRVGALGVVSAIAAVGVGLVTAAGYTAKTGDHVDELSQSLGVSADALQRLGYAAGFSSLSMEDLGPAVSHLAKHGVKDIQGEFLRLADQMQRMPNDGKRVQFALEKLGKQGKALIPFLSEGRAKLQELFAEAPVLSPETIKSSVELSDSITRIQGALKKVVFMLGAPLLKPLGMLATALIKWFNANEKLIKSGLEEFVEDSVQAVKALWSVVETVAFGFNALAEAVGGWGKVLAVAAAGLGILGIALNPVTAGLGLLLLILDDISGYFQGKDSVTGDFLKSWQKFVNLMFEAPGWQDSDLVLFLKWVGEKLSQVRDIAIETARVIKGVTGKNAAGADALTSGERLKNATEWESLMQLQNTQGTTPAVNQTDVSKGWKPVNKIEKIEIKVDGSKDPKATAEAVKDELSMWLEPAHEVYS